MSISDHIVVMEAGEVQQIGKPQEVYDDPVNLFVAKFLGTPAINLFDGEVKGGRLYLGGDDVLAIPGVPEGKVTVGIRPEGFEPDEAGPMTCGLTAVEVMGRDTSVVAKHPAFQGEQIRAIIDSDDRPDGRAKQVRFRLRPNKIYLFVPETGERIRFALPKKAPKIAHI